MKKIKVLELFAGIGACSKALERLGIEHEIVDAVEINKYAIKSFNAVHGTNFEPQDITEWDKDIECDLIMHGSPCQDFSIAGKQAGGDEGSGTRSSLLYETLRIVEKTRPKYVIWENVRNLMSARHKPNWEKYCQKMEELGYTNQAKILNAKDYGVPQNRERIYTLSIRNDIASDFSFPEPKPLEKKLKDVLEENVDEKYYIKDATNLTDPKIVASRGRGMDNEQRLEPRKDDLTNTITSVQKDNLLAQDFRIRKLTPKECWRLMGFDDADFGKAEKVNSNTQLYKQAGNSIVVNVLEAILSNLIGEQK